MTYEIIDDLFHSKHRTSDEKRISTYLVGKLPLLIYAQITNKQKDSVTHSIKDAEEKVSVWNARL